MLIDASSAHGGRFISDTAFKDEKEVVFLPNSCFIVTSVEEFSNETHGKFVDKSAGNVGFKHVIRLKVTPPGDWREPLRKSQENLEDLAGRILEYRRGQAEAIAALRNTAKPGEGSTLSALPGGR